MRPELKPSLLAEGMLLPQLQLFVGCCGKQRAVVWNPTKQTGAEQLCLAGTGHCFVSSGVVQQTTVLCCAATTALHCPVLCRAVL